MLKRVCDDLRRLLGLSHIAILDSDEPGLPGTRRIPLRGLPYSLHLDEGLGWAMSFHIKGLCEEMVDCLLQSQELKQERRVLETDFVEIIHSANEFLSGKGDAASNFSFLPEDSRYSLLKEDLPAFNNGIETPTLVTSRKRLDRVEEFAVPIGHGELFGFRSGSFKLIVHSHGPLSKLAKDVARVRTLWIDRLYREGRRAHDQEILASILRLALDSISLEQMLEQALVLVLQEHAYGLSAKGSVFLVDQEARELVGSVRYGLPDTFTDTCHRVPFGECFCGLAAEKKQLVFADSNDPRHKRTCWETDPHAHCCIPIQSAEQVLGVLNLYVPEGHRPTRDEEHFDCRCDGRGHRAKEGRAGAADGVQPVGAAHRRANPRAAIGQGRGRAGQPGEVRVSFVHEPRAAYPDELDHGLLPAARDG